MRNNIVKTIGRTMVFGLFTSVVPTLVFGQGFRQKFEEIVTDHPTILEAKAQLGGANASARSSLLGLLPELSVSYSTGSEEFEEKDKDGEVVTEKKDLDIKAQNITLFIPIYDPKAIGSFRSENRREDIAELRFRSTSSRFLLQAIRAHAEAYKAQKALQTIDNNIVLQGQILREAQVAQRSGRMTDANVMEFEIALRNTEIQKAAAQRNLNTTVGKYFSVFGEAPANNLPPLKFVEDLSKMNADQLLESVLKSNYDLRIAMLNSERLEVTKQSAWMDYAPTVDYSITQSDTEGYSGSENTRSSTTNSLNLNWTLGRGFNKVLGTGMASAYSEEEARYRVERVRRELRASAKEIYDRIVAITSQIRRAQSIADLQSKLVKESEKSLQLKKGSKVEVMEARIGLNNSKQTLVDLETDLLLVTGEKMHVMAGLSLDRIR